MQTHSALLRVDFLCRGRGDSLCAAEQEHLQRFERPCVFEHIEQIGAGHAVFYRNAEQRPSQTIGIPSAVHRSLAISEFLNSESRRLVAR